MAILRRGVWLIVLAVVAPAMSLSAGAGDPGVPPRVVALRALIVPERISNPAPVQSQFELLIDQELRRAGLATVPSSEVEAAWNRLADSLGGIFDPGTGEVDESRRRALTAALWHELHGRFGADVVLRPELVAVGVEWKRGKATWDGVSEGVATVGAGVVPCLTLTIALEDSLGVSMPLGRGGLQALAKASLWNNKWSLVPRDKLFTDVKRNARAVSLALEPLVQATPPVD